MERKRFSTQERSSILHEYIAGHKLKSVLGK
jgi:hypothetical protein